MPCAALLLTVPCDFFSQQTMGGRKVFSLFTSERSLQVRVWGPWASFLFTLETSLVSSGGSIPKLGAKEGDQDQTLC